MLVEDIVQSETLKVWCIERNTVVSLAESARIAVNICIYGYSNGSSARNVYICSLHHDARKHSIVTFPAKRANLSVPFQAEGD